MSARRRVHVHVSGRVQGVFLRQMAAEEAGALGVAGWIRNLPDGRVEAVFEGPPEAVRRMVEWCRRGTPWSRVEAVEAVEEEPEGLEGFRIIH